MVLYSFKYVTDFLGFGMQKWSKGKQKEKVNNMVLFDQATYDKLLIEVPKYKLVTPSILSDRMRVCYQNCLLFKIAKSICFNIWMSCFNFLGCVIFLVMSTCFNLSIMKNLKSLMKRMETRDKYTSQCIHRRILCPVIPFGSSLACSESKKCQEFKSLKKKKTKNTGLCR